MMLDSDPCGEERFSRRIQTQRSDMADLLRAARLPDTISFAGGLPAPEAFPAIDIAACTESVLSRNANRALQYSLTEGIPDLREWVANYLNARSCSYGPDDIIITSGSQQTLDLLGRIFIDPGDIVLIEAPTYIGAIQAFNAFEPRYVSIESDEFGMIPESLEAALNRYDGAKLLYIVPNFGNPTGRTLTLERRLRIAEMCDHAGVVIVEDDAYGDLRFDGLHVPSMASISKGDSVAYCGSASKTVSPGIRLAWLATRDESIKRNVIRAKQTADLQSGSLMQYVLHLYLSNRQRFEMHIQQICRLYNHRCNLMLEAIEQYFAIPYEVHRPQGGFFLWVSIPGMDTSALFEDARRKNVVFVPGELCYAVDPKRDEMRLSFSCTDEQMIVEGIRRLALLLR